MRVHQQVTACSSLLSKQPAKPVSAAHPVQRAPPPAAGFARIALQQGAALVPVLALGEADSLHNLVEWPALQRWCIRKLGFPVPYVIVGRWLMPLPSPTHLK
jgi:hypothetical protein